MTSSELAAICTAIGGGLSGVAAVIRWAGNRITNAIENGQKVTERNTSALLGFTAATVKLEGLIAGAHNASLETKKAVEEIVEEVTGNHELPIELEDDELQLQRPPVPPYPASAGVAKRVTPIGGYAIAKRKGRS